MGAPQMEYHHNPTMERITRAHGLGAQLMSIAAMERDDADTTWVNRRVAIVTLPNRHVLLDGSICNETTLGSRIINDKQLTREFLQEAQVSTARGAIAVSQEHALRIANSFQGPVAIKPGNAGRGRGVSVNLRTSNEICKAYNLASSINSRVIVEEYIPIDVEYRCIATDRDCISVVKRILPNVTGNGHDSIRKLILAKNQSRRSNPALRNRPIPLDSILEATLDSQGYHLESKLPLGHTITVRNVGGLSNGGEPHECSDSVGEDVKRVAISAISAIPSLQWGGVDLAIEANTLKPRVLEINASSDFGGATFPLAGRPRDVAGEAWRLRRTLGTDDPSGEAPGLPYFNTATPIVDLYPELWNGQEHLPFSSLFFAYLASAGYHIERPNPRVVKVVGTDGASQWFTSTAVGGSELMAVGRALRKHGVFRRLLFLHKVRRTRGWPMVSGSQVRARFENAETVAATPIGQAWRGGRCTIGTPETAIASVESGGHWYVQTFPKGVRLRVLTRRDTALAILAPAGSGEISPFHARRATLAARAAARAVPELRWASFDLVLPVAGNSQVFLTEGTQSNPIINQQDRLVAGNLKTLMHWLIESHFETGHSGRTSTRRG